MISGFNPTVRAKSIAERELANQPENLDPTIIKNLVLWLDATDLATITLDTTGGTTTVSQWLDKSGQLNHVSNATKAQQPLFATNGGSGGKHMLSFDGVDDRLFNASKQMFVTGLEELTFFFVLNAHHNAGQFNQFYSNGNSGVTNKSRIPNVTMTSELISMSTNDPSLITPTPTFGPVFDAYRLYGFNYYATAGQQSCNFYLNKEFKGNGFKNQAQLAADPAFAIGGYPDTTGGNAKMDLQEVLIYKNGLTSQQLSDLQDYLIAKYSLT